MTREELKQIYVAVACNLDGSEKEILASAKSEKFVKDEAIRHFLWLPEEEKKVKKVQVFRAFPSIDFKHHALFLGQLIYAGVEDLEDYDDFDEDEE